MNKLIDVKELADYLGVSPGWVYRQSEEDKIPRLKIGKYVRFRLDEVLIALEGSENNENI